LHYQKHTTMPTYSSQALIRQLQNQTEQFIDLAISQWQMIPHTTFARKPGANKWSANECLQHLNSYSRYYLPAIETAINSASANNQASASEFKAGWLGHYFTELMLPKDGGRPTKKMKAPKSAQPIQILESHKVISEFIDHQEKLLQLLDKASKVNLNKIRVPTSLSKMIQLKLGDTFNFLIAHQNRHVLQTQRALNIKEKLPVGGFLLSTTQL
jgi:uncharacterized damage-inducible protein DinB